MIRSHYKGPWIGKLPMCAICAGKGHGGRARHHLTRGVSVWLCAAHRSGEFQRRRAGRDFVASLHAVWSAAGRVTRRQEGALSDHLTRVRAPAGGRDLPGSYAWPQLRWEAEERFAAGEDPARVIGELRGRYEGVPVNPPTERTLRRWFTDGRWLTTPPQSPRPRTGRTARPAGNSRHHPAAGPGDRPSRPDLAEQDALRHPQRE